MKLSLEQIRSITRGAAYSTEEADGIHFHRFTPAQEEYYRPTGFYDKVFSTAGIRFSFTTDSRTVTLKVRTAPGSSRTYYAHDLLVNGILTDSLSNFEGQVLPQVYPGVKLPLGPAEKTFVLEEGTKQIDICLPWSVNSVLEELSLEDGAALVPVRREKKILQFLKNYAKKQI